MTINLPQDHSYQTATLAWSIANGVGLLVFSGAQVFIALRKLKADLFDRRVAAYSAVNDAVNERLEEISQYDPNLSGIGSNVALPKLWKSKRIMRLLFAPRVSSKVDEVEHSLLQLVILKNALTRPVMGNAVAAEAFQQAFSRYNEQLETFIALQSQLSDLVTPAMQQSDWSFLAPRIAPIFGRKSR